MNQPTMDAETLASAALMLDLAAIALVGVLIGHLAESGLTDGFVESIELLLERIKELDPQTKLREWADAMSVVVSDGNQSPLFDA